MALSRAEREIWRDLDPVWYRHAYPEVDRILSADVTRTPEDVFAEYGGKRRQSPNPYFSETWYRTRYPPIGEDVDKGVLRSGFDHFCRDGHPHLSPHWLFDPHYYRERFQQARGRPFDAGQDGDLYDHFLRSGQHETLSGHPLFDPAEYAARAPFDLAERIRRDGPFTSFLNAIQCRDSEPPVSGFFDPDWYRACYPAVAREILAGRWDCALHHYLANDRPAGFDPHPGFSESAYTACHHGIREAVAAGRLRNGFEHFLRHGRSEGRFFAPSAAAALPVARAPAQFPLRAQMFDSVTLLPVRIDPDAATGYSFGVLDRDRAPIGAFHEPWWDMRRSNEEAGHLSGSFIYGGSLLNHFGHFLLDSLPRVWLMRQRPDLPVLWHVDPSLPDPLPSWVDGIWRSLGLHRHAHLFIRSAVSADRLFLPDSGRQSIHVLHPANVAALAVQATDRPIGDNQVWFSRSGLAANEGRVEREDELEGLLATRGWTIVRPETLPVAYQVSFYITAAVVAGFIGSAFHSVLLAESPRARLLLVDRPGLGHENYDTVARARRLRQTYVPADFEPYERSGPGNTFTLAEPRRLADALCRQAFPD